MIFISNRCSVKWCTEELEIAGESERQGDARRDGRVGRIDREEGRREEEVVPEMHGDRGGQAVVVVPVDQAEVAPLEGDEGDAVEQVAAGVVPVQADGVEGVEGAEDERAPQPARRRPL